MNRRQFLGALGFSTAAVAVAGGLWHQMDTGGEAAMDSPDRMAKCLNDVSDLVIPDTDTPGAKAVNVGSWLMLAAEHRLENVTIPLLNRFVSLLKEFGDFFSQPREQQMVLLTNIDQQAFADSRGENEISQLWRKVKPLIIMGYYTTEVGGSEELRYELVPGEFLPAVRIDDEEARAWSSDWTAVTL